MNAALKYSIILKTSKHILSIISPLAVSKMLLRGDVGRTSEYDEPFIFDDAVKEECR